MAGGVFATGTTGCGSGAETGADTGAGIGGGGAAPLDLDRLTSPTGGGGGGISEGGGGIGGPQESPNPSVSHLLSSSMPIK